MINLNPNILEKKGKKEFVVLPYEEFLEIQQELENYDDLKELRSAKEKETDSPVIPLAEAHKMLGV